MRDTIRIYDNGGKTFGRLPNARGERMISDRAVFWSMIALAGIVCGFGGCEARAQYPRADFEMMQGKTKFHAREDGTWWQGSQDTNNSLYSSSSLLGLSQADGPAKC